MTSVNETLELVLFDELANRLTELGGDGHPSDIHGFLSGLLAAGSKPTARKWLEQVAGQLGEKTIDPQSESVLSRLFNYTLNALETGDLSVSMLLPDDDEALELRTESLGIWCQSFISGFGQGLGKRDVGEVVEEVLKDFAEIGMIEATESSEESEKLYMEVSEYVRMAWLNIFAEVNGQPEPKQEAQSGQGKTLH